MNMIKMNRITAANCVCVNLCAALLVTLACQQAEGVELRRVSIKGDLTVDNEVTYTNAHIEVMGSVNLYRNGCLTLDGCIIEIVGDYARQYSYNWQGGTLVTRNTTIGGTMRNGVAQQVNFHLNDGLWTAEDTTVQYTYGIMFSPETVGRLRATRLKKGPNPDSIIMDGKGDVELSDSTYMIALNLPMRGGKATLDLPNGVPITRTFDGSSLPGVGFQLKLKNVTVPDFWFVFFKEVSMQGKPTEITLRSCRNLLPSIMGTDLTGEFTLSQGLEQPLRIGNLTLRRAGDSPVDVLAMGLYLSGTKNNLVINGPIVICELMMFNGGQVTLKGTKNTFDATCTATTMDLHGSAKVELINARLGPLSTQQWIEMISARSGLPLQYGPLPEGDPHAAMIGQVTVGDQAQLVGRDVSLGRLRLITRKDGFMRFDRYAATDIIDKTPDGGKIEFGTAVTQP